MWPVACYVLGMLVAGAMGAWHARRMYRIGVRHGRDTEVMRARHAREKVVQDANLIARRAWLDAYNAKRDAIKSRRKP